MALLDRTFRGAIAFFCLCLLAPSIRAELRCEISAKQLCSREGCRSIAPAVYAKIDSERGVYSRCDANGCDEYPASITRSGAFANIEVRDRGMLAKVGIPDGAFLEAITLGLEVYVSFGACKRVLM